MYQHHQLSEVNAILINSSVNQMPEEEKEWRDKLKKDDQIDAIKIDQEQKVKSWGKAKILEVFEKKVKISFD